MKAGAASPGYKGGSGKRERLVESSGTAVEQQWSSSGHNSWSAMKMSSLLKTEFTRLNEKLKSENLN